MTVDRQLWAGVTVEVVVTSQAVELITAANVATALEKLFAERGWVGTVRYIDAPLVAVLGLRPASAAPEV